jgi:hypothetical protein
MLTLQLSKYCLTLANIQSKLQSRDSSVSIVTRVDWMTEVRFLIDVETVLFATHPTDTGRSFSVDKTSEA